MYPSTFLDLCKRTARECGVAGTGPAAVTGLVGEQERIVDWVKSAYIEIQNLHTDWEFLWNETYLVLDSGVGSYSAPFTTDNVRDVDGPVTIYDTAIGDSNKSDLTQVAYRTFRENYLNRERKTGRPCRITIKPNESAFLVDPLPDKAGYRIDYAYWRDTHQLVDGTDVPLIPPKHILVIVWLAVIKYAIYEEATTLEARARAEYTTALNNLRESHLPKRVIQMRPLA